jgi:hypothetical protein
MSKTTTRYRFSDEVKAKWQVRRDENKDEYIRLKGVKGEYPQGHIFLHDADTLGAWINTKKPLYTFKTIQSKVPTVTLDLDGEQEMIVSCPIADLDAFCKALKAKKRVEFSEETLKARAEQLAKIRSVA